MTPAQISKSTPKRFGRYEVVSEIATGGMATVYLCEAQAAQGPRLVAVKRPHQYLCLQREFVHMFLDEARLATAVQCDHVVSTLEFSSRADDYYLVMEYVEGTTLSKLIRHACRSNTTLPVPVVGRILCDALTGLHAAHELRDCVGEPRAVVHRDVTPQNVLVGSDGVSKIADFGVAHATSRLSETHVGQLKGKLAYSSPEQVAGAKLDRRADVFAAGVVLWEALTGRRLFGEAAPHDIVDRILARKIPSPRGVLPELDPRIEAVVMTALARDPVDRFRTCASFAKALQTAMELAGSPLASRESTARCASRAAAPVISERRRALRKARETRDAGGASSRERSADTDAPIVRSAAAASRSPGLGVARPVGLAVAALVAGLGVGSLATSDPLGSAGSRTAHARADRSVGADPKSRWVVKIGLAEVEPAPPPASHPKAIARETARHSVR